MLSKFWQILLLFHLNRKAGIKCYLAWFQSKLMMLMFRKETLLSLNSQALFSGFLQ